MPLYALGRCGDCLYVADRMTVSDLYLLAVAMMVWLVVAAFSLADFDAAPGYRKAAPVLPLASILRK